MRTKSSSQESGSGGAKMRTIAEQLNLSVATVSRALRRVPGINAETRARVFEAAAQLGYRVPQSYRSQDLQTKGLNHVGVLIQIPQTQGVAPHYLVGMSEASMGLNASLMVHYVNPADCAKILDPKSQPRAMQAGLLAGLIFVFRWPTDVVRELSQRMPCVSIMHRYPGVDMDFIGVDNFEGVEKLADHLYNFGHRKIGFLGCCPDVHWSIQRFGGYAASLTRLGLEQNPNWVISSSIEALTDTTVEATELLAQAERITRKDGVRAWICASETMGHKLHAFLVSRGLRVPEDVSLTGFHRDPGWAKTPALTSVTSSYQAIGAAALKRLLLRVQNPAESIRNILFPFELFHGETAGAPPA
jgi:DNA-binding LacI/PurR family transcriptional regulator